MESEEDKENHSPADQAPPKDDTQGPKREVLKHFNSTKRILVRAGPDNGSASAPLKSINSDLDDKLSRDPPTTTDMTKTITIRLQQGKFDLPWAIYIRVKLGHETPGNIKRLQNDQLTREIRKAAR